MGRKAVDGRQLDEGQKPHRQVDPTTQELKIHSSTDSLITWLPNMSWDLVALWSTMPIFSIKLFSDRRSCKEHKRAYLEHIFPEGTDLEDAISWWRKRVGEEGRGCAVFEAGFDTSGPVTISDPPRLVVDAATGDAEGDGQDAID